MIRDIKQIAQDLEPSVQPRDVSALASDRGNIYETLYVISKRAKQISKQMKEELHSKLQEFASSTESLEEVHENKEQIEISKFYEKMPNPAVIALNEYIKGNIYVRSKDGKNDGGTY